MCYFNEAFFLALKMTRARVLLKAAFGVATAVAALFILKKRSAAALRSSDPSSTVKTPTPQEVDYPKVLKGPRDPTVYGMRDRMTLLIEVVDEYGHWRWAEAFGECDALHHPEATARASVLAMKHGSSARVVDKYTNLYFEYDPALGDVPPPPPD